MKQLLAGLALAADPWARVPAFPTTCFRNDDPVNTRLDPAIEAVDADIARQK